jgi:phosphatidate cytidylyltransferase
MLLPRVLTALILLPLLLAAIFGLPTPAFFSVLSVVGAIAGWEWAGFMGWQRPRARLVYAALVAVTLALAWLTMQTLGGVLWLCVAALLWWLVAFALVLKFPASFPRGPWPAARMAPLGLLLIASTLIALAALHQSPQGGWRVMFMLFIVFAADVGAYLVGRNLGRRKLAPAVSPGKSVEGAIGGLLLVALWALAAGPLAFGVSSLRSLALLVSVSVVAAAFSIIGDLTESLFKRLRGLKDSSQLLPGHGGVLDRIDSILAAAPVFVLGLQLTGL